MVFIAHRPLRARFCRPVARWASEIRRTPIAGTSGQPRSILADLARHVSANGPVPARYGARLRRRFKPASEAPTATKERLQRCRGPERRQKRNRLSQYPGRRRKGDDRAVRRRPPRSLAASIRTRGDRTALARTPHSLAPGVHSCSGAAQDPSAVGTRQSARSCGLRAKRRRNACRQQRSGGCIRRNIGCRRRRSPRSRQRAE